MRRSGVGSALQPARRAARNASSARAAASRRASHWPQNRCVRSRPRQRHRATCNASTRLSPAHPSSWRTRYRGRGVARRVWLQARRAFRGREECHARTGAPIVRSAGIFILPLLRSSRGLPSDDAPVPPFPPHSCDACGVSPSQLQQRQQQQQPHQRNEGGSTTRGGRDRAIETGCLFLVIIFVLCSYSCSGIRLSAL